MTREERGALSQHICNPYYDSAKKPVKTTINYFEKQNIPQSIGLVRNFLRFVFKFYFFSF